MNVEPIQNEYRIASDSSSTTGVGPGTVSRREVIRRVALISSAFSVPAQGQSVAPIVYVGSYTGRGQGIYIYRQDLSSGMLTLLNVISSSNPSFLALDPQKRFLYAVNENANGTVSAFAVDPASGNLTFLNSQTSGGASPAHLSVHPSGKYVLVANYTGSTIEVIPVGTDGSLGTPTDLVTHSGMLGPITARQDRPHPHMIQTDPFR